MSAPRAWRLTRRMPMAGPPFVHGPDLEAHEEVEVEEIGPAMRDALELADISVRRVEREMAKIERLVATAVAQAHKGRTEKAQETVTAITARLRLVAGSLTTPPLTKHRMAYNHRERARASQQATLEAKNAELQRKLAAAEAESQRWADGWARQGLGMPDWLKERLGSG